jgi:hypothetical protein
MLIKNNTGSRFLSYFVADPFAIEVVETFDYKHV